METLASFHTLYKRELEYLVSPVIHLQSTIDNVLKARKYLAFCLRLNSSHVMVCDVWRLANRAACHSGE